MPHSCLLMIARSNLVGMFSFLGWCARRLCAQPIFDNLEPEGEPLTDPASDPEEQSVANLEVSNPTELPLAVVVPQTDHQLSHLFLRLGVEPSHTQLVQEDVRWYAVWSIPGDHSHRFSGIHWGIDSTAYAGILSLNRNRFEGIRFRRFATFDRAREGYLTELNRFGLNYNSSNRLFSWTYGNVEGRA